MVDEALAGCDDGELFLEYEQSESLAFDDGKLKSASYDTTQGFGLRSVAGEATGFAHASALDEQALKRAVATVKAVRAGHSGEIGRIAARHQPAPLCRRQPDRRRGLRQEGRAAAGDRRLCARQGAQGAPGLDLARGLLAGRRDHQAPAAGAPPTCARWCGSTSAWSAPTAAAWKPAAPARGRRAAYGDIFKPEYWQREADEAIRQSLVNLQSVPAPAGEMPVVLGSGWSGVLWHEAVGHGLEGDFHRKKTSMFTSMMGDMIASPGVTVVDDGTLADRRGSLTIDDEGTPTQRNVLIENGRLVGLMQDRQNARLMGVKPTGNGRRQSHAYAPMPRMTNTFMLGGDKDPKEIIASVKKGLYCANFGGGQVDIVSGKFVFSVTEGYLIEDGKLTAPVKGATLIGAGSEALTKVGMVGNDMSLDPGIGTCGKDGQGVPVGVGQPTLRIDALTVGGTAT